MSRGDSGVFEVSKTKQPIFTLVGETVEDFIFRPEVGTREGEGTVNVNVYDTLNRRFIKSLDNR